MNKFQNDASVLRLQHTLSQIRADLQAAETEAEQLQLMEQEDMLVDTLLARGCHLRDCYR